MINCKEKFIFLHIPKTGGTSIERAFLPDKWKTTKTKRHYNIRRMGLTKKESDEYNIFTVLRNPFTRIASTYNHFMNGPENPGFDKKSYTFNEYVYNIEKYFNGLLKPRTEYASIHRVEDEYGKVIFDSQHVETLSWWLETEDGEQANCHFLKFESIEDDWEKFKTTINAESKLKHLNASETSEEEYMSYYDKESREIIQQLYKDELRNYE
tara:strand:- start:536 stop:1168 length:633 start_codon:yes stop_codon:yes gene_type:complete